MDGRLAIFLRVSPEDSTQRNQTVLQIALVGLGNRVRAGGIVLVEETLM